MKRNILLVMMWAVWISVIAYWIFHNECTKWITIILQFSYGVFATIIIVKGMKAEWKQIAQDIKIIENESN
jgi:hypothetical protein